ncbi:ComEA family DNA-binding protein [Mycobacterium asiaticum]|uniref:Helix-hairpin-helix DNA-binding motif class 1 domain-containing protein n=1 Tax=Mycobacterium asiaticum TaxID=1790 RepID=A0A1A3NDT8_MYCAS|nr:ComEA family DNA-binding protein [Mycobacterium asiaticum]OBK19475.1 hypothetical protein A5636_19025 [Mycobacterium asiaticum]
MRTELPAARLHRRLKADPDPAFDSTDPDPDPDPDLDPDPDPDSDGPDCEQDGQDDPNSLLPRWLPDQSAQQGLLARLRADPGRTGAVALAAVAALAVLITIFTLINDRPAPVTSAKLPPVERVSAAGVRSSTSPVPSAGSDRPVVVSVVGLVHKPGLVTLTPGARIADALQAAGGAVDGADTIGLNMARPLGDGEQIVVGLAPPSGKPTVLGSSISTGSPSGSTPAPTTSGKPRSAPPAEVVDLNSATREQLDALPGVGPVTAAAIVAWRQAHGRFATVDQLAEVDGIGPARLGKLRALVRV